MALDFPASPTTGQLYTGPDGTVWKWDGAKWVSGVTAGVLSASQMDLGTRLAAAGTKLNALGPTPVFNGQSGTLNTALDAALNYNSGAANYEWALPAAMPGMCLGVMFGSSTTTATIRPAAGDALTAPGNHAYSNASPLIVQLSNSLFSTLFLIGRSGAWDVLSAAPEVHEAMGWVTHPYFGAVLLGAAQTPANNVWTKCVMDHVQYDSHGWWDAVNTRYVPKRAGKYMAVYEAALSEQTSGPVAVAAGIWVNGGSFATRSVSWNGVAHLPFVNAISCSVIALCNGTTDYIEPYAFINGATPQISGGAANQFLVTYLGP